MTDGTATPPRRTDVNRYEEALNWFTAFDPSQEEAPRAGGPLSGLLVGVKDIIDVSGWVTTNGTGHYREASAEQDASVIATLRSKGAQVVGKTTLNEFAYGVSGYNPIYGEILNPLDRQRTAGGSSGGSAAAVAAGVVDIAVGTDTSGSVRVPAACCGVYGFKAARGAFSMDGITPLAPRFDSIGFFAADVSDICRALDIEQPLPELDTVRIGHLGVDLETPDLPVAHWSLFRQDVWGVHGERFKSDPTRYGRDLRWKLALPIGDTVEAERVLRAWRLRFEEAVAMFDVLVGPVLDGAAPLVAAAKADYDRDEFLVGERLLRHTPIYNQLGWPALTCPTADGCVQIAARPGDEPLALAVAGSMGLARDEVVTP